MTNTVLKAQAFIGEIRHIPAKQVEGETEQKDKYFVNLAIPHGPKENRKYQYLSCYVSQNLHRLFASALQSQVAEEDNRVVNTLSSQIASVEIEVPFFEIKDGYLNGSGILTSVMFE